ncbi:MAG TPA: thermonuclease family protein [Burkholderiales bacterium]|nr:thermonuclease family protein [Burkholderiales bacterium]
MFLLIFAPASAAQLFGRVVAVADGDTVTVLEESNLQYKVRLAAIDAPERRQAYGERAKQHLSALVYGKTVLVLWEKRDRYGRIVGHVFARDCSPLDCRYSLDAGLEQIKAGLAWHYRQYEKEQAPAERLRYAALEQQARARREGLWSDAEPVPPWTYRHQSRNPERALIREITPSAFQRALR